MQLTLEKFLDGAWHQAATVVIDAPQRGIVSPCTVEYLPAYALAHLDAKGLPALSAHLAVSFNHQRLPHWVPFLLDILPNGFGRDLLVAQENWPRPDGPHNDANVLVHGASNPVGNLRIAEAHAWLTAQLPQPAQGWPLDEMRQNDADFLEYARVHGTLVAGTSTQGQAAKLWLTLRQDGLYYADILVPDAEAAAHYLLKMPRNARDAVLLRHEFHWLQLAQTAGLDVHGEPFMSGDLLFIPRFDRQLLNGGVRRRAVESAFSLMGIAAHAQPLRHEDIIEAWVNHADMDALGFGLLEYLKRDMLGYCLRVEDNHGRNTAFFLGEQGISLTPLFDFSPMFLDDDPPVRSTLWRQFSLGSHTEWLKLFDVWLPGIIGTDNSEDLRAQLVAWQPSLKATYEQFQALALDPRTAPCGQRFEIALGVLNALR
ncbi:HipA domain-containing protein [Chitinivorax sp. PXF-14]|uniref:HipA domain-containing protein n=1 Tax=Chitinivorax sp. PXF-14 TaxID=3230488 RepID=UPI003467BF84